MLALWKTCGDPVGGEQRDRVAAEFPQQLRLGVEHGRQALRADHHRRDAPPPWLARLIPCEPRVATGFRDPSCAHQPRRIDGTIGSANSPSSRSFLSVTWLTCPARTVGYERHTRPHLRGLRFGGRYGCYRKIAFSCVSRNSV